MKPKPTPSFTQKPATLTTKTLKPGKFGGHISVASFGATETHRVNVIELKPADGTTLQQMAQRYRVRSYSRFLEGCLAAEGPKGNQQVLFRVYED
jgi:hypothetical protein